MLKINLSKSEEEYILIQMKALQRLIDKREVLGEGLERHEWEIMKFSLEKFAITGFDETKVNDENRVSLIDKINLKLNE
jgi:hypothetical protein